MIQGALIAGLTLTLTVSGSALGQEGSHAEAAGWSRGTVFSNTASLSGLAAATYPGPHAKWSTYPSVIRATGLAGTVSMVTVRLNDWSQGDTSYVDALLESPDGRRVMLLSDAGRSKGMSKAADHLNIVFDQTSPNSAPPSDGMEAGPLGPKDSTVYLRPTDHPGPYDDVFPDLPPSAANAPSDLGILRGGRPNGEWKLYLTFAYAGGNPATGQIAGGWSIDVATKGPPPDRSAPRVSRVTTDHAKFRAAQKGGPVGRAGALIGFRLNEAAKVSFDVDRLIRGRLVEGKCKAPTKRREGKRCTRVKGVPGSFTYAAEAGDNTLRFSGRMNGKKLKPSRYRLTGLARDAAGNTAKRFSVKVKIKKPNRANNGR